MKLHLEGSKTIDAERQSVYERLTSPAFIAKTLPDSEDVRIVDGDTVEGRMKMRIAVVSATLGVRMTIADRNPPSKARLLAFAKGSGSSMDVNSIFELSGERPTTMAWTADAEISGVMAGLGSSLLKGFASKKVEEIFASITKSLENPES